MVDVTQAFGPKGNCSNCWVGQFQMPDCERLVNKVTRRRGHEHWKKSKVKWVCSGKSFSTEHSCAWLECRKKQWLPGFLTVKKGGKKVEKSTDYKLAMLTSYRKRVLHEYHVKAAMQQRSSFCYVTGIFWLSRGRNRFPWNIMSKKFGGHFFPLQKSLKIHSCDQFLW